MFLLIIALSLYFIYATWELFFPTARVKSSYRRSLAASGTGEPSVECPRYILITGCDSGFGYDLAVALDSEGWHVICSCLSDSGVRRLSEKCSSQLLAVRCDITNSQDIANLKAFYLGAMEKRGHPKALYGLVNNAGIHLGALFEWTTLEDYHKVMEVNFFGHLAITKAFLPLLIHQCTIQNYQPSSARIVNVISIAGVVAAASMSSYAASKFAFEAFSTALRPEVHHYGIDVIFVNPAFMSTEIVKGSSRTLLRVWNALDEDTKQRWGDTAFKRLENLTSTTPRLSESPLKCIHSLLHALQAKSPKRRYLPGWQAKFMFLLPYLPSFLLESAQNWFGSYRPQQVANYFRNSSTNTA